MAISLFRVAAILAPDAQIVQLPVVYIDGRNLALAMAPQGGPFRKQRKKSARRGLCLSSTEFSALEAEIKQLLEKTREAFNLNRVEPLRLSGLPPRHADFACKMRSVVMTTISKPPLASPTDLGANATKDITGALNALLADTFALFLKTKNFHWHMSGPHFRDYHLMLDDQSDELFAMIDVLAERVRKVGGTTIRSIGDIARQQRIDDNDAAFVTPLDMLAELRDDTQRFIRSMRETHDLCDEHNDVATTSLLENYIDAAEKRVWFLFEAGRHSE